MRCLLALWLFALVGCNPTHHAHPDPDTTPSDDASALCTQCGDDDGASYEGEDASDPSWGDGEMATDDGVDAEDAGALGEAADPAEASADGLPAPADAAYEGACSQPLQAGDLLVDELMVESVAGAGDDGEWLEVTSALACATNLRGLHGECPVGSEVHTFDVPDDIWLPAGGTFIVADSVDPAVNHYLPGIVLAWSGHAGDILRNLGGTVTLSVGRQIVVSLTWPSMKLVVGTSVELPSDCPAGDADDFADWHPAIASWFPAFHGTPNAPNLDVACP
jgi:hypothetical protein